MNIRQTLPPVPAADPADGAFDLLAHVEDLLDLGHCLPAAEFLDALAARSDPDAELVRARLLRQLGAERQGDALNVRTWRRHRDHPGARIAMFRHMAYRRGPYAAWRWCARLRLPEDALAHERAEFLGVEAFHLSSLRDFAAAEARIAEARALAPENPWPLIEWCYVLERADRYDEAMSAVEQLLVMRPGFRAALRFKAHLLVLRGEPQPALALLREVHAHTSCAEIGCVLFALLEEHGEHAEAAQVLERVAELYPLADVNNKRWIAARRADLALLREDWAEARRESEAAGGPFYTPIAERLQAEPTPDQRRVLLPVHFVRQHWMTCAPATLTALAHYWGREADHLDVAEAICYDGTPHYSERQWATDAGFVTREFTLDWESARALLDAGIPFTLTTTFTGSGHLQAVIGYDRVRNSVLIRDPFMPVATEFEIGSLLDTQRAYGPRAMLLVPPEHASRLDGIRLPDVALWEHYHVYAAALARHDRDLAQQAVGTLVAAAPEHRLSLNAQRTIAGYDADETRVLAQTEALLALYPQDANLQLSKASSLWTLGERVAQFAWLESLVQAGSNESAVLMRYADRLSEDGRRAAEADRILERALRYAPADAALWMQKGALVWSTASPREALPYYRYAATLQHSSEYNAASYMRLCRLVRRIEEGLEFLRARVTQLGPLSALPARTLFNALDELERVDEGFAVLDEALAQHPRDADLLLFCAETQLRYGHADKAQALLARIEGGVRRPAALRLQALVDDAAGRMEQSLAHAEAASALDPLDLNLHRLVASLRSRLHGREAALEWLQAASARFPRNPGLCRLRYEWLDGELATQEAVLREMWANHPEDVWAIRELANLLVRQRRFAEARTFADEAMARAPEQSSTQATYAFLALREQGYAAAAPFLRRAIELNVDDGYAIETLIESAPTLESRKEALQFVWSELLRQVTVGDGLLVYRASARNTLAPDELLDILRFALKERPDLWHAWMALATQLSDMGRAAEALPLISEAAERFPRLPRLHLEHARAYALMGDRRRALRCLEEGLAISPAWGPLVRQYVDLECELGEGYERAERVVRHALSRGDENADLRALLGWLLERMERHEEAIEAVMGSLRHDPSPSWVWQTARRLFEASGRKDDLDPLVDEVLKARPQDPLVWIIKAEFAADPKATLNAVNRALVMDPRNVRAWVVKLDAMLRMERYDKIDGLLAHTPWGEEVPWVVAVFAPRVLRQRGDRQGARDAMKALIAAHGDQYELWRELADWEDVDDAHEAYLACAEQLVKLRPNFAGAHGYLGHAKLKCGKERAALVDLKRALEFDPSYGFAAMTLADVALEHQETDLAHFAVETFGAHDDSDRLVALRSRVAARRGDRKKSMAAVKEVFERPSAHRYASYALHSLHEAGWYTERDETIVAAIEAGSCPGGAVAGWLDILAEAQAKKMYRRTRPLLAKDPSRVLLHELVNFCGRKCQPDIFMDLLRRNRAALREDGDCWGSVGWVELQFDKFHRAAKWYADWATRKQRPTWALENVISSFANSGRMKQSFEVAHALVAEEAESRPGRIWLALEAALRDNTHDATRHLAAQRSGERDYMSPFEDLLKAWLDARRENRPWLAAETFRQVGQWTKTRPGLRAARRGLGLKLAAARPWWQFPWHAWLLLGR